MAGMMIATIPVVLVYLVGQRHLMPGCSAGAADELAALGLISRDGVKSVVSFVSHFSADAKGNRNAWMRSPHNPVIGYGGAWCRDFIAPSSVLVDAGAIVRRRLLAYLLRWDGAARRRGPAVANRCGAPARQSQRKLLSPRSAGGCDPDIVRIASATHARIRE